MSTNVPIPTITDVGVQAPTTAAIFTGVMADFSAAFASPDMSQDPETPQGQLAVSFSDTLQAFIDLMMALVSRVDPATSSGRMQDAIGRFFALQRIAASATTVTATCGGAQATPIPTGALARTQGGDVYACVSGGVIPISGTIDLEFQNIVMGDVACPAGFLNQIYQGIPGWDTITNTSDGTPGTDVEDAQAFEVRRQAELAKNGAGYNAAIRANVLDVVGVVDCYVTDNDTGGAITIRGVTIPAGNVYICVYGGLDADVAKAIWLAKGQGVPMYAVNPTAVVVEDMSPGYIAPFPSNTITFDRPAILPIAVDVELSSLDTVPDDVVAQVQGVVLAVFAGTDTSGKGAPTMGSRLLASRFYGPIAALGPWSEVVTIKLGSRNDPDAALFTGAIDNGAGALGNVLTVSAVASGALATGELVDGAQPGTTITGQTSGAAGGVGEYTVSIPQLVAATSMGSYPVDRDYVDLNLNQRAGGNAATITVDLV